MKPASGTDGALRDAPHLRAEALVKSYGGRRVVDGVSFEVGPGEVVGLLGPNGAGKTTCFNMTVGLVAADAGRVLLGEHDLTRLPMHRRARLGLGYLPQEASIFRKLSVRQNFTGILEARGWSRRARNQRADKVVTCEKAIYQAAAQRLTCEGKPTIQSGAMNATGTLLVYDLENDEVTMENPEGGAPAAVVDPQIEKYKAQRKQKHGGQK